MMLSLMRNSLGGVILRTGRTGSVKRSGVVVSSCRRGRPQGTVVGQQQERRCISLLHNQWTTKTTKKTTTSSNSNGCSGEECAQLFYPRDLDNAICNVRQYDPSGYLPGQLLPTRTMQLAYYAVRNFWIETGHYNHHSSVPIDKNSTPAQYLDWWHEGIQGYVFSHNNSNTNETRTILSHDSRDAAAAAAAAAAENNKFDHPSLRLLRHLVQREGVPWKPESLDAIVQGRRADVQVKQYETMNEFITYAEGSCGALFQLILASGDMTQETHPNAHRAAHLVGICHGLTNALRQSIPLVSTAGKLIVPRELTKKYNIATPRYLLSALAQGDVVGEQALQEAVREICNAARQALQEARLLRPQILAEQNPAALAVLLPGLASETFLDRLQAKHYRLTDRNLRLVGLGEHAWCSARMIRAYLAKTF